jgi:hypothetical protein
MGAAAKESTPRELPVPARLPLRSDDTRLMTMSISSMALLWRCPERWRRR